MTLTDDKTLSDFEGSHVAAAKIEIADAAGGLREALAVDPVELHMGDEVHIVLHCRVKKVRFDPVDAKTAKRSSDDALVRVHVFETIEAAFIDADQVAEHVRENVDRVKREVERLAGIQRLDDSLEQPDDAEMAAEQLRAHDAGLHHGVSVEGCSACAERDADRAGDQRKDLA